MDIVSIGTEIVECVRIARLIEEHGELFLKRVYTDREMVWCRARRSSTEYFAGWWAAKEAIFKCLKTGWRRGVNLTDIELRTNGNGDPRVLLSGAARDQADKLGIGAILISISHCRTYATAYALALRSGPGFTTSDDA
jgi:holo-[acyl-carrier protein] synthase